MANEALLYEHETSPVEVLRGDGSSDFFFTCEHAGRQIPERLGRLGLSESDLERHIAWDIGAGAVARELSRLFDAPCVMQNYSRLVADCNRWTHANDYITTHSEDTPVPGNRNLSASHVQARTREIYEPYHQTISSMLDARAAAGQNTVFVSVHTCTPVYLGVHRPWHIGVLYQRDRRFAGLLLDRLNTNSRLVVGDNEPYFLNDEKDYAVPVHGERRGLAHVEFEVRQDLVSDMHGQQEWATTLHELLEHGRGLLEHQHPEFFADNARAQ